MIRFRLNHIKAASYLVLTIPVVLFFAGWLKLIIALPAVFLVVLAYAFLVRGCFINDAGSTSPSLSISVKSLVLVVVTVLLWCFLAGQGGFFYQTSDYNYRNAIFHDLINKGWPVIYQDMDATLVYYAGYWLLPAFFGKIVNFFFGPDVAWQVANIIMYVWSAILIFLISILLLFAVNAHSFGKIFIAMAILVFFSGMDIIGVLYYSQFDITTIPNALEWWSKNYQYSSNSTQLFWVFNQSTPAWLGIMLLLNEKGVKNYAYLGFILLAFSPLPFIGFLPFFIVPALLELKKAIKGKRLRSFVRQVFSVQNVIALLVVLPVYYLYYKSNMSVSDNGFRFDIDVSIYGVGMAIFRYVLFCAVEFGILALYMAARYKKDILFYISIISLSLIGMFKLGSANDFAMRASIPALMVLMVLVIRQLFENIYIDRSRVTAHICLSGTAVVLTIILTLGAFTPMAQFLRGFNQVITQNKINLVADNIKSLDNKPLSQLQNFVAVDFENTAFFKYLAK